MKGSHWLLKRPWHVWFLQVFHLLSSEGWMHVLRGWRLCVVFSLVMWIVIQISIGVCWFSIHFNRWHRCSCWRVSRKAIWPFCSVSMVKEILGSMEFRVSRKAETKSFLMMTKLSSTSSVFTNFEIFDMFNPGYSSIFTQKKTTFSWVYDAGNKSKIRLRDFKALHGWFYNCPRYSTKL